MTIDIYELKNLLTTAIKSLPDNIPSMPDKDYQIKSTESIVDKKKSDLSRIDEGYELHQKFLNRKVIALIGNVNAGKSSIGNILLNKKSSECFIENVNRETADAKVEDFDENILIDLPGLSSVLSQDSTIVEQYVSRADVLLIVQDVTKDIDKELYEFLKKVSRQFKKNNQRIIIVCNKIDNIVPELIEEEIKSKKNWFLHGDTIKGFEGLGQLFNFDIPFLTFSVVKYRRGEFNISDLLQQINYSLSISGIDRNQKYINELLEINENWKYVLEKYQNLVDSAQRCYNKTLEKKNNLQTELNQKKILEGQSKEIGKVLHNEHETLILELKDFDKPNLFEKGATFMFGATNSYNQKKEVFVSLRDIAIQKINNEYATELAAHATFIANYVKRFFNTSQTFKVTDISPILYNNYKSLLEFSYKYYLGKFFVKEGKVKSYETTLLSYKNNCEKAQTAFLKDYKEKVSTFIETAATEDMSLGKRLELQSNNLFPFCEWQKKISQLINNAPDSRYTSAEPLSRKITSNTLAIIIIIIIVIIFIIIISSH